MKNGMSLIVVAVLLTACGALKHQKSAGISPAKSLDAPLSTVQAPGTALVSAPIPLPEIDLNNLDPALNEWIAPSGKKFTTIGKITKEEAIELTGSNEESVISLGHLSFTRQNKTYQALYSGSDFLPVQSKADEDHPEMNVYLGQSGSDPDTAMILITEDDFQKLGVGTFPTTIQYDVKLLCTAWTVPFTDPTHLFPGSCMDEDSTITCENFAECSSSCAVFNLKPVDYSAAMLDVTNPACLKQDQWPTKTVTLSNILKISQYRIHPVAGGGIQASELTLTGESMN